MPVMPTFDDFSRVAAAPLHSWLGALVVTAIVTVVAIGFHRFGSRIVMRIAEPHTLTSVVLRYIDKPTLFVLVIFVFAWVWSEAPDSLHFIEPVRDVTSIALIAALTWLSVRSARQSFAPIRSIPPITCRRAAFTHRRACSRAR